MIVLITKIFFILNDQTQIHHRIHYYYMMVMSLMCLYLSLTCQKPPDCDLCTSSLHVTFRTVSGCYCFGPFKTFYNSECSLVVRRNIGDTIISINMYDIACKAYSKAMTSANIQAAFRKLAFILMIKQFIHISCIPLKVFVRKSPPRKLLPLKVVKKQWRSFYSRSLKRLKVKWTSLAQTQKMQVK